MHKLKVFFKRIRSMSFKRMLLYARLAKKQKNRPLFIILADMALCSVRYGVGYLDYYTFGFAAQGAASRREYMTMSDNLALTARLNDPEKRELFEDKLKFLSLFSEFAGREFIDARTADAGELAEFVARNPAFFAKRTGGYGGLDVRRFQYGGEPPEELLRELRESSMYCVEQAVTQHPEMNRLCAASVNTVRMVTLATGGEVHLVYSLVRMGSGKNDVDNISSGGMYCPLDGDGVITAEAFCDKTGLYYSEHPVSKTRLIGFKIPDFDRAVALVKRAALVVPEVRYVGWDVAFSEGGPLIIEGNTLPSYDMCQNYGHHGAGAGIKPLFRELLAKDKGLSDLRL